MEQVVKAKGERHRTTPMDQMMCRALGILSTLAGRGRLALLLVLCISPLNTDKARDKLVKQSINKRPSHRYSGFNNESLSPGTVEEG